MTAICDLNEPLRNRSISVSAYSLTPELPITQGEGILKSNPPGSSTGGPLSVLSGELDSSQALNVVTREGRVEIAGLRLRRLVYLDRDSGELIFTQLSLVE